MSGKRINDPSIPSAVVIKDTDTFYLIQDGVDYQISGAVLKATLANMANPMTAKGDLIAGGVAGAPVRFAIGAEGKFLSIGPDNTLTWVDRPGISSGEGLINPMTAQNDLIVGGVDGEAIRLEGGSAGQYLTVDGGVLVWKDLPVSGGELTNPMTSVGDMIIGGADGVPTRLEHGTNGWTLKMVDDRPTWVLVASARHVVQSIDSTAEKTLIGTDDGKYFRSGEWTAPGETSPSVLIWTVGLQATANWAPDAEITIEQAMLSQVSIVGAAGVTINKMATVTNRTRGRFAVVTLKRVGTDVWTLFGQLETP